MTRDRLLRTIGEIYDSAEDVAKWPVCLSSIGALLQGTSTNLIYHDHYHRSRGSLQVAVGADPELYRWYQEYVWQFTEPPAAVRVDQPGNPRTVLSDTPLRMKWILRRSTSNTPTTWRVGFMDDVLGATPANGMYFEARAGEWWAVTRAGGISLDTATGVAAATNWQMLQVQRNASSGAIEFYINGVLRASDGSNLPNQFVPLNLALQLGGQGDVLIDYVSICLTGLQRNLP